MSNDQARKVWTAGAAVAAFGLLHFVPVPGVDNEKFAAAVGSTDAILGLFYQHLPMPNAASLALVPLIVCRALLALWRSSPADSTARYDRITFLFFIAWNVLAANGVATTLEQTTVWEVVPRAGPAFRAVAIVTLAAGGAITWWLSRVISESGAGHGPLILTASAVIWNTFGNLVMIAGPAGGVFDPEFSARPLAALAVFPAATIVLAALAVRATETPFPLVRGIVIASPVDLVALPFAAASLVAPLVREVSASMPSSSAPWIVTALVPALVAANITAWLFVRPSVFLRVSYALAALGVPAACAIVWLVSAPAPFEEARELIASITAEKHIVVLRAQGGSSGEADGETIVERLRALKFSSKLVEVSQDRIVVSIPALPQAREAVATAIDRRTLELRAVAENQHDLEPPPGESSDVPGLEIATETYRGRDDVLVQTRSYVSANKDALAPIVARAPSEGGVARIQCNDGEGTRACSVWFLESPPIITDEDLAHASVGFDEDRQRYHVALRLRDEAADHFADATERLSGRKLAIVIGDEITSAPIVMGRISGGNVSITLGAFEGPEQQLAEAKALATVLDSGRVRGTWVVESFE